MCQVCKFAQKPDLADQFDAEFVFDGTDHFFRELPDILRGTTGIGDDDVGVFFVKTRPRGPAAGLESAPISILRLK